jgi:hypothetical protein
MRHSSLGRARNGKDCSWLMLADERKAVDVACDYEKSRKQADSDNAMRVAH